MSTNDSGSSTDQSGNENSPSFEIVWECDYDAYKIHTRNDTIIASDDYAYDHDELCDFVGINWDDTESWSCEIVELDPMHERLRVGDKLVCAGYGCPVYFVRELT